MEKETLEEAAKRYANDWEEIHPTLDSENMTPIAVSKIDFIEGAKWQSERMYSEDEVDELVNNLIDKFLNYNGSSVDNEKLKWFYQQFKKK